jgi:hypothetical protein
MVVLLITKCYWHQVDKKYWENFGPKINWVEVKGSHIDFRYHSFRSKDTRRGSENWEGITIVESVPVEKPKRRGQTQKETYLVRINLEHTYYELFDIASDGCIYLNKIWLSHDIGIVEYTTFIIELPADFRPKEFRLVIYEVLRVFDEDL